MTGKQVWEEHDVVYHYTNHAGLEGILLSQELHATHFKYVNDTSEMMRMEPHLAVAALPSVKDLLNKLSQNNPAIRAELERGGGLDATAQKEASNVAKILYDVTFGRERGRDFFDPYLISFCAHKDEYERKNGLLSQWRGYGKESGYAIAFRTKGLTEMMREDGTKHFYFQGFFGDVVYEGNQDHFKKEFSALMSALERIYPDMLLRREADFKTLHAELTGGVGRFKHRGFTEESEVRMLLSPYKNSDVDSLKREQPEDFQKNRHKRTKEIKFKSGFTPYICVPAVNGALPIEKIIVGPHRHKAARAAALARYAQLKGLKFPIITSDTPLE